jgi:hypothetical protein
MVRGTCHCGAVAFEADEAPTEVTDCNCSICRRYGPLWAYYPASCVRVTGATDTYTWSVGTTAFHRCLTCGCVTHWSATEPQRDRVGLNARMFDPPVLAQARVRHLDGANTDEYFD